MPDFQINTCKIEHEKIWEGDILNFKIKTGGGGLILKYHLIIYDFIIGSDYLFN